MKERVLKEMNSPRVKADVFLWVKITTFLAVIFVGALVFTPVIANYIDSWHPFTQCGVTVLFLLLFYLIIRKR